MDNWACSSEELKHEGNEQFRIHKVECSPGTTYGQFRGDRHIHTTYQVRTVDGKYLDNFYSLEEAKENTGERWKEYRELNNII